MRVIVVGMGPGDPGQLTRQAWNVLSRAGEVYLRTRSHPTVPQLPEGPDYHSFDDLYEQATDFEQVYETIVEQLVSLASEGREVIYAVPGDPLVGEGTVTRLAAVCKAKQIDFLIIHGVSFVEPALAVLGLDGISGIQLLDATDFVAAYHPQINPDRGALVAQVYSQQLASDVKLTLMNQYPDDHPVTLIHAAGTSEQRSETLPLYEMDRRPVSHLTTLYIAPFSADGGVSSFEGFQETIAHLRSPEGCPWDREQTHQSLRPHLIEEAYEVLDAIDADDVDKLREELGDLLLQVVLHSQVAVDEGEFHMADVIRNIDAKLKRRHPHVWGQVDVQGDPDRVLTNWEQIKAQERADNGQETRSLLDGIPKTLPALAQAHEYDDRAVRVGFDWPDEQGVIDKVHEELDELLAAATPEERLHEIGDLLFVIAVWARWLKLSPEDALRAANRRFYERFSRIERRAKQMGRSLREMSIEEMDILWNEAKRDLAAGK
ncbi:MAG: nucleoside triphosphate pyrophosphohydrolase [Anaerolineae bacterium]|nr:nucleoside triphosphate pyrophosphohydrolase [Anaerolineae bacterium]